MEFRWDPKPADHYVLIPVLGYRERTLHFNCNSFERRADLVLHRPSRCGPRSLDRRTGRTFLAPVLDTFSITDPAESLLDFIKRLASTAWWYVSHPDSPKLA